MTMFICWVVFPAVLSLLSIGCGLLLEAVAGMRLPGVLLAPAGLATIIVVSSLTTMAAATASLTVPLVVALTVAGLGLSFPWRGRRIDGWILLAAVAVFAVYAAPIVLSGQATFAGYIKLDDTATWLALTDRVLEHGRSLAGLAPSSYRATLNVDISQSGYPVGSVLPLGIGAKLVGQDPAWVFQPYLAYQGALLALAFQAVLAGLVRSPRWRFAAVFLAAQPALLYGYSLWGAEKELVTVPLLALIAALLPQAVRAPGDARRLLPLAVAVAAVLGVLNVGGGVWVGLALLFALGLALRLPRRVLLSRIAVFGAFALVLSIPTLATAKTFLGAANTPLTSGVEFGNLIHRLSWFQIFGIWPVGDFRLRPHDMALTYALIGVLVLAAAWGLLEAARRRSPQLLLYTGISVVGCIVLSGFGSPWVAGKALATASPAFLLVGLAGSAVAYERGFRVEAAVAAAVIAGGVLWSNGLAYREAWLAPRDQLSELELVGKKFAGQGPALMTEYQPYGVRHFLRRLDAEGASELRVRLIPLRSGLTVPKGGYADIDDFRLDGILVYRTLVLDRSPLGSRPPSPYQLVWRGRFYEVWQRPQSFQRVLDHLSLGSDVQPAAVPACADVLRLAKLAAAAGGTLAAVPRPPAIVVPLSSVPHPSAWAVSYGGVYPYETGTAEGAISVPRSGRYGLWLGGSFPGQLEVSVDGRVVDSERHRLEHPGQFVPLGEVALSAGRHRLRLRYDGPSLHPGSGAHLTVGGLSLGPLVLGTVTAQLPVRFVPPSAARSLCGQSLDWIEALAGSRVSMG